MKLAIMPNLSRTEAERVTADICKNLKLLGAEFTFDLSFKDKFDAFDCEFKEIDSAIKESDAVIAVGGDGSIIHAAQKAVRYGKPILGINAGRLAFMAGLEDNELNLLSRLIEGKYELDRRFMLKTVLYDDDNPVSVDYALNECFVTNGERQRMTEIDISLNGKKFNEYLCDGVIAATPTGSTAYSLSAGGPVVDPELESIIFTPVCPHSLVARSIMFKPDALITVNSGEETDLYYSNDGTEPKLIKSNQKISISGADFTADFIRIKSDSFIDILYKKLSQRK